VARCVNVNTYHVRREFKFKFKLIFFFLIFIFFFIITAFLTFFAMLYSDKHGYRAKEQFALWGGGAKGQSASMPHRMRATTSTDVALTEALEAMRSRRCAAWARDQCGCRPHGAQNRCLVSRMASSCARGLSTFSSEATSSTRRPDGCAN
jgi:hypothetical protein